MRGFGPPVPVTAPSTCPWLDHRVSGLYLATRRPVKTRFPFGSPIRLTSLQNISRWPIIQKVRSHPKRAPTACTYKVSGSISLPSPGFFSPFLHSTGSLSVNQEYLALEDGPPIFKQDITCPALLVVSLVPWPGLRVRGYHPVSPSFPACSSVSVIITNRLLRVRSPLLTKSRLISFPRGT